MKTPQPSSKGGFFLLNFSVDKGCCLTKEVGV